MDIVKILKEHFSENLTEEVEGKIKDAFEFAVSEAVSAKEDEIKESLETKMTDEIEVGFNELKEKLNTYIEKANVELIDENLKNIEGKAKVELAESLVAGILTSLKENDMNVAVEQKDIIGQLEEENKKLEASLNETVEKLDEGKKQELEYEKAIALSSMTEKLVDTKKQKIISMLENVAAKDIDEFKTKVESAIDLISEKKVDDEDDIIDENFDGNPNTELDIFKPKWLND